MVAEKTGSTVSAVPRWLCWQFEFSISFSLNSSCPDIIIKGKQTESRILALRNM